MGRKSDKFAFVNFGSICSNCSENCCRRFYAVLLPEEEEDFRERSFELKTELGCVRAIGARSGAPCPYLDEAGMCSIYPKRPLDCRLWPVMVYYDFETGDRVVYLDLDCPAVSSGRIPRDLIESIVSKIRELDTDEEWLKKYTLAPWPNHLIEIVRLRNSGAVH
ncbi:MAG: YkgJ family cysteine cluster protein [Sulfolobales archaeon]|nr:YkgJ family cysteine cluster protein [Sulfolobales archaeon]MCX8209068.1 YkgJ family cysteine cluster protein [Sulfolobales archaeon]MDW8009989.1 YkgJ family cysteine cluster protein [Sulfolobales archaeon]